MLAESETPKKTSKGFGDLSKLYQQRGKQSLPILIRQAKSRTPIYYSDLANELGMPNARNLNYPLGAVGHEMLRLGKKLRIKLPPINCLVINKQKGLPGEGINFLENGSSFKKLSPNEQKRRVDLYLRKIYDFPNWDLVLEEYGLKPSSLATEKSLRTDSIEIIKQGRGRGESDPHRLLKKRLANSPALFNLPSSLVGEIEYPFPSADCIDILFRNGNEWVGIEVKGPISNDFDLQRGIFQCIKYQALMEAEQRLLQTGLNCRMIFAISRELPPKLRKIALVLGIEAKVV